jgi:hypothetical protein
MIQKTAVAVLLSIAASSTWLTQCHTFHGSHRGRSAGAAYVRRSEQDSANVISGDRTGTLVSADWIRRYKQLETRYGTIPEDGTIYMEGDKYRVPSKVADHFGDMVRKE